MNIQINKVDNQPKVLDKEKSKEFTGIPSQDKPWLKWYSKEALEQQVPKMTNYDYLKLQNKDHLQDTALNYFGIKTTYEQLFQRIEKAAKAFQALGVKKGDIVTFCVPTLPETIYAFYALNRLGAIANMIDPRTNVERIIHFIEKTNSRFLVMIDQFYPKAEKIIPQTKIENVISIAPTNSIPAPIVLLKDIKDTLKKEKSEKIKLPKNSIYMNYPDFLKWGKNQRLVLPKYQENRPACIVYTGGTTGIPKGALLSNENLNAISLEQKYCTNMTRGDKFLNIMPPFIAYGMVCGIASPLCSGLEIDIIPKFNSLEFDTLLVKHQPNHVLGVPKFFSDLSYSKNLKEDTLKCLKSAIAGGTALYSAEEDLINACLQAHQSEINITKGYGMTELSSVATYTIQDKVNKPNSVGIPVMLNNIKILDPITKKEVGYDTEGELYVTGPGVILGYYQENDQTNRTFITDENGVRWVKTEDYFSIDQDGVLFIKDRMKRMLIRPDGHNVFPSTIEKVLLQHKDVKACVVIGIKENQNLDYSIPTAVIVLQDGVVDTERVTQELEELSLRYLPERDKALQYIYRSSLPMTPAVKIDYRKVEEEENEKVLKKMR